MTQATLSEYVPALRWMRGYTGDDLKADMVAGLVVAMMLIPQSLAYALLAGVPAEEFTVRHYFLSYHVGNYIPFRFSFGSNWSHLI